MVLNLGQQKLQWTCTCKNLLHVVIYDCLINEDLVKTQFGYTYDHGSMNKQLLKTTIHLDD